MKGSKSEWHLRKTAVFYCIVFYYLEYCWGFFSILRTNIFVCNVLYLAVQPIDLQLKATVPFCLFWGVFAVSKQAENLVCNNWVCKSLQLQPCSTYYQHMIAKTCAQSLLNKVAALHQGCTLFARQSRSANSFLNLEKVHSPSWVHCSKPQSCCGLRVKKIMEFTECWRELFNFRKKKIKHTHENIPGIKSNNWWPFRCKASILPSGPKLNKCDLTALTFVFCPLVSQWDTGRWPVVLLFCPTVQKHSGLD